MKGCVVEFVGGPFDGHVEQFAVEADQLPQDMLWLVSENVFRLLDGKSHGTKKPISSAAIYECQLRSGNWAYCFVATISPQELGECYARGDFKF